jgi:hypothetical protein
MPLKYHKTSVPSIGDTVVAVNYVPGGDFVSIKFSSNKIIGIPIAKEYTKEEIKQIIIHHVKHQSPINSRKLGELMKPTGITDSERRAQLIYLLDSGQLYMDEKLNIFPNRRRHSRKTKS